MILTISKLDRISEVTGDQIMPGIDNQFAGRRDILEMDWKQVGG
jgi:hypothetical protein